MRFNIGKLLRNIIDRTNNDELKWSHFRNNKYYSTYNCYDHITNSKKIQFQIFDFQEDVKKTSVNIHYMIRSNRTLIYSVTYFLCPSLISELMDVLNDKLNSGLIDNISL